MTVFDKIPDFAIVTGRCARPMPEKWTSMTQARCLFPHSLQMERWLCGLVPAARATLGVGGEYAEEYIVGSHVENKDKRDIKH